MALYDVFLSFRTCDTHKTFTGMLEAAIMKDFISNQIEDLVFSTFVEPPERFDSWGLYWDEREDIADQIIISHGWKTLYSDFNAFNIEKLMVSSGYGSVYKGELGMRKMPNWKKALVEAAARVDAITIELIRKLEAKCVDKVPRSDFCCYVDSFPNLQKKKGISWEVASSDGVSAPLNILIHGEFTRSISKWENFKLLDLHHAFSTRHPQPYITMYSNAPILTLLNNQRASESEEISSLIAGRIKGMNSTYNWSRGLFKNMTKQAPPAHPPPDSEIFPRNNHMNRESSIITLLITICMVTTFLAALGFSSSTFKDAYSTSKDAIISRIIISMNTLVFIVSLVIDMFLLHKSTYKWELQIMLFALFGAYICLMKVMVPQAAFPLFLISIPFLFFAAT